MTSPSETAVSDATVDLGGAPFVRARRGRVAIEIAPVGVQVHEAERILGFSRHTIHAIPFGVLPYSRVGTHRWYLVRHLHALAEQIMALQITRGQPASRASMLALICHIPTPFPPSTP